MLPNPVEVFHLQHMTLKTHLAYVIIIINTMGQYRTCWKVYKHWSPADLGSLAVSSMRPFTSLRNEVATHLAHRVRGRTENRMTLSVL